jgi:Family of unknown function (DUF5372)
MSSEGQKARVVDGLIPVVTGHHDFHVVVQAGGCGTLQVFEGADMFTDRDGKVLRFYEPDILTARVTQYVDDTTVCSVPPQWTDVVAPDPKIVMGEHRALFRVADLLELERLVNQFARRDPSRGPDGV